MLLEYVTTSLQVEQLIKQKFGEPRIIKLTITISSNFLLLLCYHDFQQFPYIYTFLFPLLTPSIDLLVTIIDTDEADVEEIALVQAMVQDQNCLVDPCSNNATCVDGLDTFFCVCAQGYTGLTCGIGRLYILLCIAVFPSYFVAAEDTEREPARYDKFLWDQPVHLSTY